MVADSEARWADRVAQDDDFSLDSVESLRSVRHRTQANVLATQLAEAKIATAVAEARGAVSSALATTTWEGPLGDTGEWRKVIEDKDAAMSKMAEAMSSMQKNAESGFRALRHQMSDMRIEMSAQQAAYQAEIKRLEAEVSRGRGELAEPMGSNAGVLAYTRHLADGLMLEMRRTEAAKLEARHLRKEMSLSARNPQSPRSPYIDR